MANKSRRCTSQRWLNRVRHLLEVQGGRCFYCGQPIPEDVASIEHLVPRSAGGGRVDNLVVCCRSINAFFGDAPLPLKLSAVSDPDFIRALSRWCLVVGRLQ